MDYLVGVSLALAVGIFARIIGFDRDRSFYPVVLIVIAAGYILFAAMSGSTRTLAAELLPTGVFIAVAMLGYKGSPWFLVAGLIGHGVFDFVHPLLINNAGVPVWWPGFCSSYDVVAGALLAFFLFTRSTKTQ